MKQYSFLTEATLKDFFISTIGTFRNVFSSNSIKDCMIFARSKGFRPLHVSKRGIYDFAGKKYLSIKDPNFLKDGVSSMYYTNGKQLLRISDHWSESNMYYVNTCKNIKNCYWRLIGKQDSISKGKFNVGIINLDSLNYRPDNIQTPKQLKKWFGDTLKPKELSQREAFKMLARKAKEDALNS